ncbi:hypothetical protein [Brasilonema sp. UFV-L1]|uniref:hypothetical protein n=1 Tax=Brasilonema sp. UFV-L1 TaxID=2234130 RepID=UPI00145D42C4|nr:hypothetical protein [Brasilonema sp. UFV-L1]NMG06815.1 hypothetical protein [Brasilonema sp. UFV-L1]
MAFQPKAIMTSAASTSHLKENYAPTYGIWALRCVCPRVRDLAQLSFNGKKTPSEQIRRWVDELCVDELAEWLDEDKACPFCHDKCVPHRLS